MSVRHLMLRLISAVAILLLAHPAVAGGELNILSWEGYADASFVKPFEKMSGCRVSATYVGSNDEFVGYLRSDHAIE
jgi:spermidine/putrescine-binding protein